MHVHIELFQVPSRIQLGNLQAVLLWRFDAICTRSLHFISTKTFRCSSSVSPPSKFLLFNSRSLILFCSWLFCETPGNRGQKGVFSNMGHGWPGKLQIPRSYVSERRKNCTFSVWYYINGRQNNSCQKLGCFRATYINQYINVFVRIRSYKWNK